MTGGHNVVGPPEKDRRIERPRHPHETSRANLRAKDGGTALYIKHKDRVSGKGQDLSCYFKLAWALATFANLRGNRSVAAKNDRRLSKLGDPDPAARVNRHSLWQSKDGARPIGVAHREHLLGTNATGTAGWCIGDRY
jgi:hypothetical protein